MNETNQLEKRLEQLWDAFRSLMEDLAERPEMMPLVAPTLTEILQQFKWLADQTSMRSD